MTLCDHHIYLFKFDVNITPPNCKTAVPSFPGFVG